MAEKISQTCGTKMSALPLNTGPQTTCSLEEPPLRGAKGTRMLSDSQLLPMAGDICQSLAVISWPPARPWQHSDGWGCTACAGHSAHLRPRPPEAQAGLLARAGCNGSISGTAPQSR